MTDGQTDGQTEAIAISPTLFLKRRDNYEWTIGIFVPCTIPSIIQTLIALSTPLATYITGRDWSSMVLW